MKDIRTRYEMRHGWWVEERATVPCAVCSDGAIVVFQREDIESLMDEHYPHAIVGAKDHKVWWFNETRDREIAEIDVEGRISCNPQVLWRHFLPKENK